MKSAALYLLVLAVAAAGGYLLRGWTTPAAEDGRATEPTRNPTATEAVPWIEDALKERSGDTIDDLVANHTSTRLPRMTLWLIDASTDEILELWRALDARDELDMRTYDLILIHWAELDPRGAITAAKESRHERAGWWAWGRADPELAFQTALRESPDKAYIVLRSIGQYHIDIAMRLKEQHPEALNHSSIEGIGSGLRREDPEQAVEFMRGAGQSGYEELKDWAEKDPDRALAWARTNLRDSSGSGTEKLVSELVIEHPDRVPGWLAELPSGGLRSALAEEYVRHLAGQDVKQALEFANAQEGIAVRSRLMAALGTRLAYQDPEQSITLLRKTLEERMDAQITTGTYGSSDGGDAIGEWSSRLMTTHPEQVLDMAVGLSTDESPDYALGMMSTWLQRDEAAYAEWLINQGPGSIRDRGTEALVNQLMGQNSTNYGTPPDFVSALGWAASIHSETRKNQSLSGVVANWISTDPSGAEAYFQNAPADAAGHELFDKYRKP